MGTVIIDHNDPSKNQIPDTNNPSTSEQILPTNQPTVPPIDPKDKYISTLEAALRDQNTLIQKQHDELSSARKPAEVPKTAEEERNEFFNDPKGFLRRELQETVAPLIDFVHQQKGLSKLDEIISRAKVDPRFLQSWDPTLEAYVRQQASILKPEQLTEQNVGFIIVNAIGAKYTGLLPYTSTPVASTTNPNSPTPPAATNPNPNPMVTPPSMRPSPPSMPEASTNGKPPVRQLTENEAHLARLKGMTPEQYLDWMNVPASGVTESKIGRAQ